MRVIFTAALIAAIASAGGAPSANMNNAKRHENPELARPRYSVSKTLINPIPDGETKSNMMAGSNAKGYLSLQVVLKANDEDRSVDELHTTLKLYGDIKIEENEFLAMGWAMHLKSVTSPWLRPDGGAYGEEDRIDGEGSTVKQLQKHNEEFQGTKGWDGVLYESVVDTRPDYTGSAQSTWNANEIWSTKEGRPDILNTGMDALNAEATSSFVVKQAYSGCEEEDKEGENSCQAKVYSVRNTKLKEGDNGYNIVPKHEMAYDFIGWYQVLKECDGTTGEQPFEEESTACIVPGKGGQTQAPVIFVLGAVSGLAAASVAILSAMLF